MRNNIYKLFIVAVFLLASACSSSKKDQSYVSRVFHNTSAHYNGYYYARLKLTEAENRVIQSRKPDYQKLMPLYLTGNPEDAFSSNDMDSVVKKMTIAVKLHPKSKWADDCYFHIGKAYYYKKNYEAALSVFQFVSSEFKANYGTSASQSKKKSSKKKKGKSDKNVNQYTGTVKESNEKPNSPLIEIGHKPIHYTNALWLIRSLAMLRNFGEAQAIIAYLQEDKKFPPELKIDLEVAQTFVYIEQKQYKNAANALKSVIAKTRSMKDETRYTYILAQLYKLDGDFGTAGKYFAAVSDLRPNYEMDFNARINVVKSYIASGSGSPTQVLADIDKMAKNKNFEEFNDQIYYYKGLVHLFQGKDVEAIKDFEESIVYSFNNTDQKGLSYLKMGEIAMKDQDYLTAAPYYDSAVAYLNSKFDTITRVKELSSTLNEVARQSNIIYTQDSLQRLAAMPEKERIKIVDQAVAKVEREKEAQRQSQQEVTNVFGEQLKDGQTSNQSSGTWYFYNTSLKSVGYNEFVKMWGKRDNEDHWRRSDKRTIDGNVDQATLESETEKNKDSKNASDAKNQSTIKAAMLDNIPTTPDKLQASNQILFDAYYSLGILYSDNIHNDQKAIATLEIAANKFSDHKDIPKLYYKLYLLYNRNGSTTLAKEMRDRIEKNYPESIFASVLKDPEYFKKLYQKENEVNVFYASTYDYYKSEKFNDVFKRVRAADSLFKPNPLEAKFQLLNALATGKTKDRNAFIKALDSVVAKYPNGEEHDKAVEILTALGAPPKGSVQNQQQQQVRKDDKKPKGPSPYTFKPNNPHYLVVAFDVVDSKTKAIGDSLANYNSKYHSLDNLKVTPQLLDKNAQIIVVKQFKNQETAMDYYDSITESETLFEIVESIGYRIFVIDDKNFTLFYNRKNLQEYIDFFEKNYENDDEEEEDEDEGD